MSLINWGFGGLALVIPLFALLIAWTPKQHERALLIVDDLDRCEPDQMLAVIESLCLFLDDEEMSRRLQVAMLIDRKILNRAVIARAETSNPLLNKESRENFFRQQEEKLFVVSLELPPLERSQAEELASKIVNREYLEQLEAKAQVIKTIEKETHVRSVGPIIENAPRATVAQDLTAALHRLEGLTEAVTASSPVQAAKTMPVKDTPQVAESVSMMKDVTFSDEERNLLAAAITHIAVDELTPRSLRAFVLRYQLVRLLLQRLGQPFQPDRVIGYLAARLFGNPKDLQFDLDPKVHVAIGCVV